MARIFRLAAAAILSFSAVAPAAAQRVIDVGAGGADATWRGPEPGSRAGMWLDQGPMNAGDARRDLIIGAPGDASTIGRVYVLFAGRVRSGDFSLTQADATITGAAAGDLFGISTAVGNILNPEDTLTREFVVGAPGSFGGRGAVYLFRGGLGFGATRTTADAAVTIIGNPGDHLGTMLATGDLNNDTFREIIIGAPGTPPANGRIYIINGGPSLIPSPATSRTIDLSTESASSTIVGAGIGEIINAGDVTGDNVFDIVIGAPSVSNSSGAVYLVAGRALGGFPSNITLPSGADATFTGSNANDLAGSTLRTADLDADGFRDIVIGAPGGDGPDGTRTDSGEVYVVWGTNGIPPSINLANAPVTFYGAQVSDRLGAFVTSGDVNRDTPNDLALRAGGGAGSVGQLALYYGRARSQMGTALPDGRRRVDFAVPGQVDRVIRGDAAAGPLVAATIFEVTGEGARDIILTAPFAATDSGALSGNVYLTISPRLSVSPSSVEVGTVQNGTANVSFTVSDASTIEVTWTASSDHSWIIPSPTSGTSVKTASGIVTVNASAASLTPGSYTSQVVVSSTSRDLAMTRNVAVRFNILSAPTLTANPAFPVSAGSPVTFTANATGGTGALRYKFYRFSYRGAAWTMVQDYSPSNTFSWTPAIGDAGDYVMQVWVRDATSNASWEAFAGTDKFTVTKPAPKMTSLTANVAFPAAPGTPVTFTAQAVGGVAPLEYKFWRFKFGSGWTMVRDWTTSNTFTWTPTVSDQGTYSLQAWVRNSGGTELDDWKPLEFTVSKTVPKMTALSANVAFPAAPGTPLTFTAQAVGGVAPLEYKFWRFRSGVGWTMVRDWATSNTFTWTPTASDQGTYSLQAWVRNSGGTDLDDWKPLEFSVQSTMPVFQSLTANRAFPAGTGTPITWRATVIGGTAGPLQYKFWRFNHDTRAWTVAQDYSSNNTFTWSPGYGDVGTYTMQVWTRSAASTASFETWMATDAFSIVRADPMIMSFTANTVFPAAAGTPITWTAQASGGGGTLEYQFWRFNRATSSWTLAQPYGTSNTFTWTPSATEKGTYTIQVWVRTVGTTVSFETWTSTEFFTIQ